MDNFLSLEDMLAEQMEDPEFVFGYFEEVLKDKAGDPLGFKVSLSQLLKVHRNLSSLAESSGLTTETLYDIRDGNDNAGLEVLWTLCKALRKDYGLGEI